MFNYQVIIEYDGTICRMANTKKWISVQANNRKTLTKILKEKITIYGSGRTDSGVHAIEQSDILS